MDTVKNVWVVAEDACAVNELVSGARSLGETVDLVYLGGKDGALGADKAYCVDVSQAGSFALAVDVVADLVANARPELVLIQASSNGRLAAAAISAALDVPVMTDASELAIVDGMVEGTRMVYGGAAFKTERVPLGTALVVVGAGAFEPVELAASSDVADVDFVRAGIRFLEKRPRAASSVNLAAAKCVVGVGRGLGSADMLGTITDFARALGGEVGCTRPVAEEQKWMPKEAYIGVSGRMLKPDVYVGVGVSGQVQHMVGVNQAQVIVVINKDKNAPIFKQCDLGIVGDLNVIIPALLDELG